MQNRRTSAPLSTGDYVCGLFGLAGAMSESLYRTLLAFTTDDAGNWFQYSNPEFDAIVAELATTADKPRRSSWRQAAMEIWLKDMPAVNWFSSTTVPPTTATTGQLALDGHRSVHERHSHAHRLPLHVAAVGSDGCAVS